VRGSGGFSKIPVAGGIDTNTAAGKVLAMLDAFSSEPYEFSLTELARRSQISKPTAFRILAALEGWGGVRRTPSGRYRLGIKFFELGGLVPEGHRLRDLALPYMEDLVVATQGIVHLAKLEGTDVLVLDRLVSHRLTKAPSRVAGRAPATCTSVGKAILAYSPPDVLKRVLDAGFSAQTPYSITDRRLFSQTLKKVREDGVAFDQEELIVGLVCVGAPVFDHTGSVVAGMSVSGPATRWSLESLVPAVKTASMGVSRALGYRHPELSPSLTGKLRNPEIGARRVGLGDPA
jgi:IclR family transcriptional regulator, acetate operon repressor